MDRRRFLGSGAASAAALAGTACAPALRLPEQRPNAMPPDVDDYIASVDAGMERLGRWSSATLAPDWTGDRAELDRVARTALQSLYFTGMVGDLPLEGQLHPEMQLRIHANMALMDDATDRMSAFLESRTRAELATVQLALREHGVGPQLLTAIDDEAGALGLSSWRRAQTRTIYSNAEWRLRNQPPTLLVTEYLEKVERLGASDVTAETRTQALAARLAEEAFWQQAQQSPLDKRAARIRRGGRTMGFGLLTFAAGGAIVAAGASPGVFVMTVGAVMMIIGLLILLVGLGTRSTTTPTNGAAKLSP